MSESLLRMEHITKRFPGVLALDDCGRLSKRAQIRRRAEGQRCLSLQL
jgi:ABC-type sugar transport system ATPase subunit